MCMDDADELEAGVIGSLAFLQTRLLGGTTGRDFSRRSLGLARVFLVMSEGVVHSQSFEAEEAKSIERAEEASNESNELLAVRLKASNE